MERPTTRSGKETLPPETRLLLIEQALERGAKSFTVLEGSLKDLQDAVKPKKVALWPIITFGFVLLNAGGAWLWNAAQYPRRDEFDRGTAVTEERYERLRQDLVDAGRQLLRLQLERDAADARVARVEGQLDATLRAAIGRKK